MDMPAIKEAIRSRLTALGYCCYIKRFTVFQFEMAGNSSRKGYFEIASANAKRFEITIEGDHESNFNIQAKRHWNRDGAFFANQRFAKHPNAIPEALEWIANAVKSHAHLHELLHPEASLPEAFGFAAGGYVQSGASTFHGFIVRVKPLDIVAVAGRLVIHTAYNPNSKPYFLMEVDIRRDSAYASYGRQYFVTDGDIWYPVRKITVDNREEFTIFMDPDVVLTLKPMNANDKLLLYAALRQYTAKLFSEEVEAK